MIKGFKDFLLRGNVVDLAVAFVIGAAFAAVITTFTEKIIQPIINSVGGRDSLGLGFFIRDNDDKTFVDIGALITALINFVIVAAAVYFIVVVPVTRLMERRNRGEEPPVEAPTEDIVLLREIRDSLQQRSICSAGHSAASRVSSAGASRGRCARRRRPRPAARPSRRRCRRLTARGDPRPRGPIGSLMATTLCGGRRAAAVRCVEPGPRHPG